MCFGHNWSPALNSFQIWLPLFLHQPRFYLPFRLNLLTSFCYLYILEHVAGHTVECGWLIRGYPVSQKFLNYWGRADNYWELQKLEKGFHAQPHLLAGIWCVLCWLSCACYHNHCEFCCGQLLLFNHNGLFTCSHLLPQLPIYSFQQSYVNGFCTLGRIYIYTLYYWTFFTFLGRSALVNCLCLVKRTCL